MPVRKCRKKRRATEPDSVVIVELYSNAQIGIWRTLPKFNQWLKSIGLQEETRHGSTKAEAVCYSDENGVDWLGVFLPPRSSYLTISHESLHLAYGILDTHGVKVSAANHEALAYLQEFISKLLIESR